MGSPEADFPIRPLEAEDLDAVLELYGQFGHDDDPAVSREHLEQTWREIRSTPTVLHLGRFAADGTLVSTAHASFTPNLTRGARPYAVVENVVTRTELRGQGHGGALLQALIDACWERGCYKIMLLSGLHRPEAHRFYARVGFDPDAKRGFVLRR